MQVNPAERSKKMGSNVIDITPKKEQNNEPIPLAAYCRVSSSSEDQIHSFVAQIKYYKDYERKHTQYKLVDIYADEGITGTSMEKRDEFIRMISDCEKGKIKRIVVKSVSRFARNTEELILSIRKLKELGVSVYFEEQDIDTDKLTIEMILTFPGIAAQKESETISGNLRWSIRKRMESGRFIQSNPPYGYKLVNKELVIYEEEAKVVRKIFDLYLQGYGKQTIANMLNEEGVPRRFGYNKWHRHSVNYILNNERYMGDALLQKEYTIDTLPFKKVKNRGELPQYYVENNNLPILSRETFMKVKELSEKREQSYKHKSTKEYLLTGMIHCAECGRTFRRQIVNEKIYWLCSGRAKGITECKSKRVKEDSIYDAFTYMIIKLYDYRRPLIENIIHQIEQIQSKTSDAYFNIKKIDKEIADLATQRLIISRLNTVGKLNLSEYEIQSSELDRKIYELRSKRKKLLAMDENDSLLDELKTLNRIIKDYTPNNQFDRELFDEIVENITVKNCAEITFKLIGDIELTETIIEKGRCKSA